jgi:hypothetical protein
MRSMFKHTLATAALVGAVAVAGASQAAIFIGLKEAGVNGGLVTTVASGPSSAIFAAAYGTFELELLTGQQGVDPTILGSTTSDHNIRGSGGTLDIYITRNNITGGVPFHFLSSFTSNALPAKWSVVESTYVSTSNQLFAGTLLSSHTFSALGTFLHPNDFLGGQAGPYSVTTRYTVTAPTTGSSFSTISIHDASVPEPAAWALMIMGFGAAGGMLRGHRRKARVIA